MGKGKYVLVYGILCFGLVALVLTAVSLLYQPEVNYEWYVILFVRIALFLVVGFIVTNFSWESKESRYAEYLTKQKP